MLGGIIIGIVVISLAWMASNWRAKDPKQREGKAPPIFEQLGKTFMWLILAALIVSVAIAVSKG